MDLIPKTADHTVRVENPGWKFWLRSGGEAVPSLAPFNQTETEAATIEVEGADHGKESIYFALTLIKLNLIILMVSFLS